MERLGRALLAVPTGQLRVVYLEERLRGVEPLPLVRALACAQREATLGSVAARVVIDTFGALIDAGRLEPMRRSALVAGAQMVSEDAIIPIVERGAVNDGELEERARRARRGTLADTETLGRRKSLARTATGDVLLKLLDDPHPDVIKNAMLNPRVTESLAVRVAARRPVPSPILEVVARSRFGAAHAVRRALVLNPSCPSALACRLIASMTAADLDDVRSSLELSVEVKSAAEALLRGRSR